MSGHPSTLDLHRYRYGELDVDKTDGLRMHLDQCDLCADRHRAQVAEREAFTLRPVPAALRDSSPSRSHGWLRWVFVTGLVAAAVMALFTAAPPSEPPTERLKGSLPDVEVWLNTTDGPRQLRAGEAVHSGDTIQVLLNAKGASTVWLAGMDGHNDVEVYGSFTPQDGGLHPAPFSLTLDDAAGPQRIFVVVPDSSVDAVMVKMWVQGNVPAGVRITEVIVPKE